MRFSTKIEEEIKRLKEQTQSLLSRKQIIESLQGDRAEAVHLLNEMVKQVPEGVLSEIAETGWSQDTDGRLYPTNARVSALMRNLEASPWIEKPQLIEIKAVTLDKRRVSEFSLSATLTRPQVDADKQSGKDKK